MDNEKSAKKNLIPIPFQRAFYAGLSAGGFSFVFGVPAEYILRIGIAGACYSLVMTWHDMKPGTRRSKRRIPLNGNRTIDMEYSVSSNWLNRLVFGKDEAKRSVKPTPMVPRPTELDEFIFISNGLYLREVHVRLFLKSAWRNRKYGKGLSERRWVREFSQRPAWYQELSTDWYYAMMRLLFNAQSHLKYQMIVVGSNRWFNLANEPFMTMRLLKWYESEKK